MDGSIVAFQYHLCAFLIHLMKRYAVFVWLKYISLKRGNVNLTLHVSAYSAIIKYFLKVL
jgi:hypothetical protein